MTLWFYPIDWEATGSWMQAWAGLAGAGAVFYAAHRGSSSFQTWLRQRKVERKLEAGERILTVIYRAKDAFEGVRSALVLGQELDNADKKLRNDGSYQVFSEDRKKKWQTAQVTFDRMNAYAEVWKEIFATLPIARTYFGSAMEDQLRELLKQRRAIEVSAEMYPEFAGETNDPAFAKQIRRDMWAVSTDDDPILKKVNEVIAHAEKAILPLLSDEK